MLRTQPSRLNERQRLPSNRSRWGHSSSKQQAEAARQAEQTQQLERARAAQQLQIAGTRAASQAVSQSMQILSSQNGQQAPTAAVAKRKGKGQQAGPRTAATSLRMGSTSSAAGAGPNIAV